MGEESQLHVAKMPNPTLSFADALRLPWVVDNNTLAYTLDLPSLSESQRKAILKTLETNGITAYDFGDVITIPPGQDNANVRLASGMRDLLDIANLNWGKEYSREKFQNVWRIDVSHLSEATQDIIIERLRSIAGVNAENFSPLLGNGRYIDIPADAVLGGNLFRDSLYQRSFGDIRLAFEAGVEVDRAVSPTKMGVHGNGEPSHISVVESSAAMISAAGTTGNSSILNTSEAGVSVEKKGIQLTDAQLARFKPESHEHVRQFFQQFEISKPPYYLIIDPQQGRYMVTTSEHLPNFQAEYAAGHHVVAIANSFTPEQAQTELVTALKKELKLAFKNSTLPISDEMLQQKAESIRNSMLETQAYDHYAPGVVEAEVDKFVARMSALPETYFNAMLNTEKLQITTGLMNEVTLHREQFVASSNNITQRTILSSGLNSIEALTHEYAHIILSDQNISLEHLHSTAATEHAQGVSHTSQRYNTGGVYGQFHDSMYTEESVVDVISHQVSGHAYAHSGIAGDDIRAQGAYETAAGYHYMGPAVVELYNQRIATQTLNPASVTASSTAYATAGGVSTDTSTTGIPVTGGQGAVSMSTRNAEALDSLGAAATANATNTLGGDGFATNTSTVAVEPVGALAQGSVPAATTGDVPIAGATPDLGPATLDQTMVNPAQGAYNYSSQNDVAAQSDPGSVVEGAITAAASADNAGSVGDVGAATDLSVADGGSGAAAGQDAPAVEVAPVVEAGAGVSGAGAGQADHANGDAAQSEQTNNSHSANVADANSGHANAGASAPDATHSANMNTSVHGNGHVPDAPHVGTHVVGVASTAMSVLGVKDIMQRMENGEEIETHEVLAAGLGATDGLGGAMKLGLDDLAVAVAQGTKLANGAKTLGKFGIIGTVVTAVPDLYHAHAEGNAGDKGAAYGQLAGGVAVTVVGAVAGVAAAPLVAIAIPVVEAAQTVGRPLGQLFSDDPKEVAAGKQELATIGERYSRPVTGGVDLSAQAVRSIGGAAKGLGDGVGWLGDKIHAVGSEADEYIKNSNLVEPLKSTSRLINGTMVTGPAIAVQVAGRTVQAVGATVETIGHTTSRVADEMGKAIKEEVSKEGLLKGTVTGVAKGAVVIYEKAGPYVDKKLEEAKAAYQEYMPTWLGGDEPKPEANATAKPAAAPAAPKKSNLKDKQAEAQLAKLAVELEGKGYKAMLDRDHDGNIEVDEIRTALKNNGVTSLAALDVNANGNISGKELADALLKPPVVANAKPKEAAAR